MKKHLTYILPISIVIVAALGFAGYRLWGTHQVNQAGRWPELQGGVYAEPVSFDGLKYLVPPNEVYATGLSSEDRPALFQPKMVDIATADTKLADDLEGLAVDIGEAHYFYPFQILNWHETVNDELNGVPLAITYSPLTGSAAVYSGLADATTGERFVFSDSGKTYNNALLMSDAHGTLWNQTSGQALVGESVGQFLTIYPSSVMSWAVWKDAYPNGLTLSTDTGFARDYGRHPYASYETTKAIYFPVNHTDSRVSPKELVYRIDHAGLTAVFIKSEISPNKASDLILGEGDGALHLTAFADREMDTVRFYNRVVDGRTLTFEYDRKQKTMIDVETGSQWSVTGVAISGSLRGTALMEIPATRHYAFAHFAMFPNTLISGEESLPTEPVEPEGEDIQIN